MWGRSYSVVRLLLLVFAWREYCTQQRKNKIKETRKKKERRQNVRVPSSSSSCVIPLDIFLREKIDTYTPPVSYLCLFLSFCGTMPLKGQDDLLDAMKAKISSSSTPADSSSSPLRLEGFEDSRDALISHFRESTRKCLLELSERRREEILEYYYRELIRFVYLKDKSSGTPKKEKEEETATTEEIGEREGAKGMSSALVVRPGEGSSPSPSITRAIASRIHYFHSMEATVKRLATIEAESASKSFYVALAAIVGFLILLVGGGIFVFGTDNEFRSFLTDTFTGQRRTERRTFAQLFAGNKANASEVDTAESHSVVEGRGAENSKETPLRSGASSEEAETDKADL